MTARVLRFAWILTALTAAVVPLTAHAETTEGASARVETPRELSLRAYLGGYDDLEANTGGFNVGGTALYRHGFLIAGGLVEHGGAMFNYQYTAVAPAFGISMPVPSWARVELVVTAGAHIYSGVDKGFIFSSDPGASATVPFGGARAYAGVPLGGKTFAFTAGFTGWIESDVFRPTVTYTFRESFLTPRDETVTRTVGMSRAGLALVLGGTFGL